MESPQNYSDHHSCLRTISTHTTGPEPHSPPRLGLHLEQAHAFLQLSACALLTRLKSLPTDNHSWFPHHPKVLLACQAIACRPCMYGSQ